MMDLETTETTTLIIDEDPGQVDGVKASPKLSKQIKMAEIEVRRTELCYVTSVNRSTRTFFAQLCKFSNEELIQFNHLINTHCTKLVANNDQKSAVMKVHRGDLVCAKFPFDNAWYRALILSRNNEKQTCSALFVDYGNLETLSYKDLVHVDSTELAVMERAPFGISCLPRDSEELKQRESEHFLDCLAQNYVMIKVLERQTKLQWKVDIPMHAYNIPFWLIYKPELRASGRKNGGLCSEKLVGLAALDSPPEARAT